MNFVGYVACYLSILLNSYVLFWCYSKTGVERKSSKIVCLVSVIVLSVFVYLVNVFVGTSFKWIVVYTLITLLFYFNYKEGMYNVIFKSIIVYVIMIFADIVSSIVLIVFVKSVNIETVNLFKALGSFLNSTCMFLMFSFKPFVKLINSFFSKILKKSYLPVICVSFFLLFVFWLIGYYHKVIFSSDTIIISIIVMLFLMFLFVMLALQYLKNKNNEIQKQQLLVLMHEYENVLNQTSENRHEMLNDLLILRSIADKNSSEFTRTLDGIIRQYDTKKFKKYTSLAKLPTGVKGMIYYKIAFINENEINFDTVVNGVDYAKFEAMDKELYYKVCKILGILMDNAIDACVDSDKKKLVVSVYTETEDLCVEIDNSYSGIVDTDEIKKKGYTTKGKNHGYGLTILNRIVDETEELEFEQSINDNDKLFTSILKIKL